MNLADISQSEFELILARSLRKLFTPDQFKVLYRGNFTIRQAALYFGTNEDWIEELIEKGEIAINLVRGERRISREECNSLLRRNGLIKTK